MTASVLTSRKAGPKVARTQLHVSSVYSRKSTKYLPAPPEGSEEGGEADEPGVRGGAWCTGCGCGSCASFDRSGLGLGVGGWARVRVQRAG